MDGLGRLGGGFNRRGAGRHGVVHLRADDDFFFYSTVILNAAACLIWLGLAAFAVLVLMRWKDWA